VCGKALQILRFHFICQSRDLKGQCLRCFLVIAEFQNEFVVLNELSEELFFMPGGKMGIPVKVNIDSGGKPNGIPERR
jgi:hypothetical protein